MLNNHKTSISEITTEEWNELSQNVRKVTIQIEKKLKPKRCYISSLGATQNLPNTCPHVHFNVIPIYNEDDKPSEIFTWQNGIYEATNDEWNELHESLKTL